MITRVSIAWVLAVSIGLSSAGSALTQERPTFRARADLVSVDVSVRNGDLPVLGLAAADFRLFDNGVVQTVEAVETEAVPIDVTLFHDTSPSLAGKIDALKADVRGIAAMLRPMDRLRLLTFDLQVNDVFGWQPAGGSVESRQRQGRSNISDLRRDFRGDDAPARPGSAPPHRRPHRL